MAIASARHFGWAAAADSTAGDAAAVLSGTEFNLTIGKLGLTDAEENDLVAFLETLTDGFVQPASLSSTPASTIRKPATPPKE